MRDVLECVSSADLHINLAVAVVFFQLNATNA